MFIYLKDNEIMASSEEYQDYSEFGWDCEETDEEIVQINGQLYKSSETPEPTEEEIKQARINELKQKLSETDYVVIKIAEGVATNADYIDILKQRKSWRAEINTLEAVEDEQIVEDSNL